MCRKKKLTKHHRKPQSKGGSGEPRNISKVPEKKHEAWHILFGNSDPQEIAETINSLWLDPNFRFVCVTNHR